MVAGLTSCDLLDVSPEQSIEADEAMSNAQAARAALNGAYDGLQQDGVYGGFFTAMADFTADNAIFSGSFTTWQNARDFNKLATHGPTEDMWEDHYDVINRANNIIARVPELDEAEDPEATPEFVDRVVGEATFIRALAHFNLIRLFAEPYEPGGANDQPGVPLVTEPTESADDELDLPRSSVDDVYQQIVSDLQNAQDLMPTAESGGQVHATADAATALLAKVRLYQGEYAEAASLAESVIDDGPFELAGSPTALFDQEGGSSESIFAISYSSIDNTGVNSFPSSFYMPQDLGGRGDITVRADLIDAMEEDDERGLAGLMYEFDDGGDGSVEVWTHKWSDPNLGNDAFVLRLAEMYLIAAEGLARTGDDEDQAEDYLNVVRERAGASTISASGQDLIDAIIEERRIELAFEGDRRHDIVRLGEDLVSSTTTAPEEQKIFPIPSREIDVNDNLEEGDQNPGY